MIRVVRKLARDERGNSFVEMGLVLPIFSALLMGMVDVSRAYSSKLQLAQAAQRSIEYVQVRDYLQSDNDTIKANAAAGAGVSTSAVTVTNWLECDGVKQSSYDTACTPTQTMQRFVYVTVTKNYTPFYKSKFFPGANSSGVVPLTGKAGIRVQ